MKKSKDFFSINLAKKEVCSTITFNVITLNVIEESADCNWTMN